MGLSSIVWNLFGYPRYFDEGRGECIRPATDVGAKIVSGVFSASADGHLYDHGSKRREDQHKYRADDAQTAIIAIAASEKHPELRQH